MKKQPVYSTKQKNEILRYHVLEGKKKKVSRKSVCCW